MGCLISADTTVSYGYAEETTEFEEEKQELPNPEDVGRNMAFALLNDIKKGGVVDSTHQVSIPKQINSCSDSPRYQYVFFVI